MHFGVLILFTAMAMLVSGVSIAAGQANGTSPAALTRCGLRETEAPRRGMLAADPENIYLGTVNGTLSAYEAKDLKIVWRLELGGEFASEMVQIGTGLIVVTNSAAGANGAQDTSTIRLISKDSGVTVWSARLPFSESFYLGRLNGGVAAITRQGSVILLDIASGQIGWQTGALGTVSVKPAFSGTRMAFGTTDKQVISVSAKDGELVQRFSVGSVPTSISFSKDGGLVVGDARGSVSMLGPQDTKPIWKFKSGAGVSSAVETDDGVLLTSLDNFVYLVSDYNGDVIWKRRLSGRVVDGGLIVNGHLVVLVYGENAGYVLDLATGKVSDALQPTEKDLVNRTPVFVRDRTFALTTTGSLETYSIGPCGAK